MQLAAGVLAAKVKGVSQGTGIYFSTFSHPPTVSKDLLAGPPLWVVKMRTRFTWHLYLLYLRPDFQLPKGTLWVWGQMLTLRLCSSGAQSESARSKMLSGVGGFVLGLIFLGLGLFIRHRKQKGKELWGNGEEELWLTLC